MKAREIKAIAAALKEARRGCWTGDTYAVQEECARRVSDALAEQLGNFDPLQFLADCGVLK